MIKNIFELPDRDKKYKMVVSNRGYGRQFFKRANDLKRIEKFYDEGYAIIVIDLKGE